MHRKPTSSLRESFVAGFVAICHSTSSDNLDKEERIFSGCGVTTSSKASNSTKNKDKKVATNIKDPNIGFKSRK